MIGLPKSTELSKQLPKKAIYSKFNMNTKTKEKFDADIRKITIVNEVSSVTTNILKGNNIQSFFVLLISLKNQTFDDKNIALVSKLIPQNMLFILKYNDSACLAIYHTKLMQSEWVPIDKLSLELKGLNFDSVWENIVIKIGGIAIEHGNSLDEQIVIDEKQNKLQNQIEKLEKQVRTEKQPKKKFELVQEIKKLEKGLKIIR